MTSQGLSAGRGGTGNAPGGLRQEGRSTKKQRHVYSLPRETVAFKGTQSPCTASVQTPFLVLLFFGSLISLRSDMRRTRLLDSRARDPAGPDCELPIYRFLSSGCLGSSQHSCPPSGHHGHARKSPTLRAGMSHRQ